MQCRPPFLREWMILQGSFAWDSLLIISKIRPNVWFIVAADMLCADTLCADTLYVRMRYIYGPFGLPFPLISVTAAADKPAVSKVKC